MAKPVLRLVSIAYWSTAPSIRRRSLRMRLAWERLRARRNPGTAIAARSAMMATTIMISTRVKAWRDFDRETFILTGNNQHPSCQYIDRRYLFSLLQKVIATAMPKLSPDDYDSMASFRHLVRKFLRFSRELVKSTANLNSEQYEALLRSEEHTSELQSPCNLVCRLLLEKTKKNI